MLTNKTYPPSEDVLDAFANYVRTFLGRCKTTVVFWDECVCVCEDLEVQGSGFDWWVLCYGGGFGEVAFDEGLKGQWWGWCFLIFVLRFMRMFEDLGLLIDLV